MLTDLTHSLSNPNTHTHTLLSLSSLICWSSSILFNEEVWKLSISLPPACPPQTPPGLWAICHGAVMGLCLPDFWCAISIWTASDRHISTSHSYWEHTTHNRDNSDTLNIWFIPHTLVSRVFYIWNHIFCSSLCGLKLHLL